MKLRSVAVNNLRRFTSPVEITGLSDGLNVLAAPNEQGKSTLFDGLQALFFIPHSGRPKEIQSLQPHAKGAPEVAVEIETPEGHFRIAKRWMSRARATVHRDGRLIAQADEAEAFISRLASSDAGGPAGLLWVRQGLTGLAEGGKKELELQRDARRDLLSSVAGEVEAMTGGQRMDAALKRCREELDSFATGTGKPRTGGPWKAALDRAEDLRARRDGLAAQVSALADDLAARKRARAELAEIEDPEAVARRTARLQEASEAHAAAERHAQRLEGLTREVRTARLQVDQLTERRRSLTDASAERGEARAHVETATGDCAKAREGATAAEEQARGAQDRVKSARDALLQAQKTLTRAQVAGRARDNAARRAELAERLEQAEGLQARAQAAQRRAKGPTAKDIRTLERLTAELDQARALQAASATHLRIDYDPGGEGRITRDGAPLSGDAALPLVSETTLDVSGVGRLIITPGAAGDDAAVSEAQDRREEALRRLGCETLTAARATAETRAEAEKQLSEANAALHALLPRGLDALRADLAALPAPEDIADAPPLEEAERARAEAESARIEAESRAEVARDRLGTARASFAAAQSDARSAQERLSRAEAALERLGHLSDDSLAADLTKAQTALTEAESARAAAAETAPDIESAAAALARAQSAQQAAQEITARLRPEIARLDERISQGTEGAIEERLAETEQDLAAAEATLARISRDVAVLNRLKFALESARSAARERYFSPIANALRPLLHLLWPEAVLEWDDAELLPSRLIRDGLEEPIDVLSGGTQEQLALLVRLAFARLLAQDGRAAPVILDDALVYTDDDRIERMFDALHRQAGDVQILVLTCRQRAFRDLGGQPLRITPKRDAPDSLLDL